MRASLLWHSRIAAFGLILPAAAAAPACGANCDRNPDEPPVRYTEGTTDLATGTYESASIEGPYLTFPGGRTYRFVHGLGSAPQSVEAYLAFEEYPSSFVPGAGNQATFEAVGEEFVDVRNDTCSTVRLRVVLKGPVRPVEPPDGGDAAP